ncbi:hypothetical protein H6771_02195 [Candidatus Peribacteria bacterium]|nr:hypothetical protein [Candidatus Peribacteria bacterium]
MAILPLQKIRIMGLRAEQSAVMTTLQDRALVHLEAHQELTEPHHSDAEIARVAHAITLLEGYTDAMPEVTFPEGKQVVTRREYEKRLTAFAPKREEVLSSTEDASERLSRLAVEQDQTEKEREAARIWESFPATAADLQPTAQTAYQLLQLSDRHLEALQETLEADTTLLISLLWGQARGRQALALLLYHQSAEKQLRDIIAATEAQAITLEPGDAPAERLSQAEKKLQRLAEEQRELLQKLQQNTYYLEDLRFYADHLTSEKALHEAAARAFQSERVFVLEGWVAKKNEATLREALREGFGEGVIFEAIAPAEGEKPPVLTENKKNVTEPYKLITEMYGTPSAADIDPTPSMTPFFFISFGLCLSDVGYGIMLLLLGLYLKHKTTHSDDWKQIFQLLVYCGIGALLGGIAVGGYFGITPAQAPLFLLERGCDAAAKADCSFIGQFIDPMGSPISFLIIACSFGMLQLMWGIGMNAYKHFLKGDRRDGIVSVGWVLTLLMLVLTVVFQYVLGTAPFNMWYLVGAAALVVFTGGALKGSGVMGRFFSGLLGFADVTSYLSVVLSFSRVMALGMATGVVAFAMNLTAGVLYDVVGVPVLAHLIAVAFLIFGHLLNFGLSMFSAFVHSMRLQFIEYFGQFFAGGGRAFAPLQKIRKYVLFSS